MSDPERERVPEPEPESIRSRVAAWVGTILVIAVAALGIYAIATHQAKGFCPGPGPCPGGPTPVNTVVSGNAPDN